jgi:hypothetical protein
VPRRDYRRERGKGGTGPHRDGRRESGKGGTGSHRNWTTERRQGGTVQTEAGEEREGRKVLFHTQTGR